MRALIFCSCLAFAPFTLAGVAVPQDVPALNGLERADEFRGRQLAERFCVNCHVVLPDEDLRVLQTAPSFREIARRADQSPTRIAGAMILPHPDMPAVPLTNVEIRNIVGYILSLKTKTVP